ncbi:MAG: ABC transporter ATP-binding protein [Deltaproteobacteria bacterium]|nr:ABC transporter ATP-binding protein [Deltaproteobacteria bacterium]MBW2134603.1 ABC transporter ATP-binding protein [Deltaproteobacteria bacterium]
MPINSELAVLEISDLEVYYGSIPALKRISLQVPEGLIVTLIGANGAGKSTTIGAITGLVTPRRGRIIFTGQEIQGRPTHTIMRLGLAVCPEGRRVFANLTVKENLILGGYHRRDSRSWRQDLDWLFELFPRLHERLEQTAGTLSGGEQQMLALARALMSRPRLLLLDEPSLGLAPLLVQEVFKTLEFIHRRGTTLLLVEQNALAALKIAHYGYVLETGRVILEGSGAELLHHPQVKAAYLGEA